MDRNSFVTRGMNVLKSIKRKIYINKEKSLLQKQLNNNTETISPLVNFDFENTEEFNVLIQNKNNYQYLNIEGKNEIKYQYDLMIGVTVYNGEKYIERCIDSLLTQKTEYSFEIVIVDDGSTDNTPNILEKYKSKKNIRILTQENKGVSSARNRIIKEITGKYFLYIDSDDELKDNAIQLLLKTAFDNNADIVEGSYIRFDENGEFEPNVHKNDNSNINSEVPLFGFPWGKVIRANLLKDIVFPEGYIYEDSIFAYCIHNLALSKYTLSEICYKYRNNTEGLCATSNQSEVAIDTFFVSFYLWKYYSQHFSLSKHFYETVVGQIILNYYRTRHLSDEVQKAAFKLTQKEYIYIFEKALKIEEKYKMFDLCMRCGTFEQFCKLVSIWNNLT